MGKNGYVRIISFPDAQCMAYLHYLPTKLGSFGDFHVGKYSSPMEHLGLAKPKKLVILYARIT